MAVSAALDAGRWGALMTRLGLPPLHDVFERLQALHAEPHRHYHTAAHVNALLAHLDREREDAAGPDRIELAIWFHDAVYKPTSKTNVTDSAAMARDVLAPHLAPDVVDWVERTIRLTADHGDTDDPDTALMLDLDLSGLGADADVYDAYTRNVRREYRWVPGPLFRRGRRKVLDHVLAMPRIYKTDSLAQRWEAQARANLRLELKHLS